MIRFFVQKYTCFYDKITLYFENRGICSAQNYCGPNGPWYHMPVVQLLSKVITTLCVKISHIYFISVDHGLYFNLIVFHEHCTCTYTVYIYHHDLS